MTTTSRTPSRHLARRLLATLTLVSAVATPLSVPGPVNAHTVGFTSAPDTEDAVWSWPISPKPAVTRPFDLPFRYGAGHRGIDLAASPGAQVLAPADGTVHFVGVVVDRPVVSIDHGGGLISSFEPVTSELSRGDRVVKGQVIGELAASPTHAPAGGLHLGARQDGEYLDPRSLLGEIPRAVLLPLGAVS
ncbi:murein hydrolase activator EnvC family protein [Pseudoclavibacter albus]|uniref:murein hydrolase activator EnvC family protein n=1 Tax=Pseudoclavibacter albus TaxID=272241 RepID=UPI000A97BAC3|nr:M23 family metallopeptidase [Pseudoclavibacter alba]